MLTVTRDMILPTTITGSYPRPLWFDRSLEGRAFKAALGDSLFREQYLDAVASIIAEQETAGLDIVTDGEMRRESYSNRFATALEGVDVDNPGTALDRSGHPNPVPRVVGPIARKHPVQVRDLEFLKAHTSRTTKMTVPGPFTMSQQAQDDHYGDPAALGMAYAEAVRGEILDLFEAGADIVQVDEPYMQARPEPARQYGLAALKHATDGIAGSTAVHICFGYAAIIHEWPSGYSFLPELGDSPTDQVSIETAQSGLDLEVLDSLAGKHVILGVLDLSTDDVETPETVADRIRRAFPHADARRLIAAPDCGMKYLPRDSAYGKLEALVEGARMASS